MLQARRSRTSDGHARTVDTDRRAGGTHRDEPLARDAAPPPGDHTTAQMFGLDFVSATSVAEVASTVLELGRHRRTNGVAPIVVTPNVDHLVQRARGADSTANDVMERAAIVLPDGQPIVWASRMFDPSISTRLPGSSLVAALWPTILSEHRRALVVASSEECASRIRADGPSVRAVTAPMLDLADRDGFEPFADECLAAAIESDAEFVFVTLGFPKQENVISAMADRWPDDRPMPVFLAVGASFDMYHGIVRRAPEIVQRLGMEWFFRFVQEPRRLFRRYFVDDVKFLGLLVQERRLRGTTS